MAECAGLLENWPAAVIYTSADLKIHSATKQTTKYDSNLILELVERESVISEGRFSHLSVHRMI